MLDFDFIDWDDDDDPQGNVRHIAAAGLTPADVEGVLYSPRPDADMSDSSGRPCVFGYTADGRYIIVVYDADTAGGVTVIRPRNAFEVDEPT